MDTPLGTEGAVLAENDGDCTDHCGSELAREGVRSDNVDVECTGLFASKLATTGEGGELRAGYCAPNIAVQ